MKCIACGSTALVAGTVYDNVNGGSIRFKIDEIPIWKSLFGVGIRKFRAYGCVHCQHLQFAVDFNEKDVQRYNQFEGEQPSILERISSESESVET